MPPATGNHRDMRELFCRRVAAVNDGLTLAASAPERPLLRLRHRPEAFEEEPLHSRAGVRLGRVQVPFRIGRQVVHAEELPGATPAVTKRGEHLERAAKQDVDLLVYAIGRVDICLL